MNSIVFDGTGKCVGIVDTSVDASSYPEGYVIVQSDDHTNPNAIWYDVASGEIKDVSGMEITVETNKISNIPPGTTIGFYGESYVVDDGIFEFEVTYPQTVTVVLTNPRYVDRVLGVPCEA